MANPEHLKILEQGVEAWNAWREENPGVLPDHRTTFIFLADLEEASLARAQVRFVNLRDANFTGADLTEASMGLTILAHLDLRNVTGLETVFHVGPSTLGVDTLQRSGPLPVPFLRGCGLSDWEIVMAKLYDPELTPGQITDLTYEVNQLRSGESAVQFFSAFMSYSHDPDAEFAQKLHHELQDRGVRCWLDKHDVLPGDDLYRAIDRGLRTWDKVLLCCSKAALTSPWVKREVETAIEREMQLEKERGEQVLAIIPIDLDGYLFEWDGPHAATLRKRLAADFKTWKDDRVFKPELEKLILALRADPVARRPDPVPKL